MLRLPVAEGRLLEVGPEFADFWTAAVLDLEARRAEIEEVLSRRGPAVEAELGRLDRSAQAFLEGNPEMDQAERAFVVALARHLAACQACTRGLCPEAGRMCDAMCGYMLAQTVGWATEGFDPGALGLSPETVDTVETLLSLTFARRASSTMDGLVIVALWTVRNALARGAAPPDIGPADIPEARPELSRPAEAVGFLPVRLRSVN